MVKNQHMTVDQVCVRDVVTVEHDIPLVQCAQIMHDEQVGSLVMTAVQDGMRVPVGILTDRDITVKVVAFSLDPNVFTASDIMARPLVTARFDEQLVPVLARMRNHGVHRVPVLAEDGSLFGILSVDDIWETLSDRADGLEQAVIQARQPRMVLTRAAVHKATEKGADKVAEQAQAKPP
jgi:predicted transcriptional regulator